MPLKKITLTIGGMGFSVSSRRESFISWLALRYRSFLSGPRAPVWVDIHIRSHDFSQEKGDIEVVKQGNHIAVVSDDFDGRMDLKRRSVQLRLCDNPQAFDPFLRVFYSVALLEKDGFLMHAAGLEKDGKGYLFPGPSSSGKTTLVKRSAGFRALSDELVIVRKIRHIFYLFSTPFRGEHREEIASIRAPLKRILFLNPELPPSFLNEGLLEGNILGRQAALPTMLALLESVFFFSESLDLNNKILNLCGELSSQIESFTVNLLPAAYRRRMSHAIR